MDSRIDSDGLFQGYNVRVRSQRSGETERVTYLVDAEGYIELETNSLEMANGIASALQATVPAGHRYDRTGALWALGQLVSARRFLADLLDSQADGLGEAGERLRTLAQKLYGDRHP